MDWKVERRIDELEATSKPSERKLIHKTGWVPMTRRSTSHKLRWLSSSVVLLVLCQILTPASCFFFPRSLFQRLAPAPQPSQHSVPSRDARLVASASEQQQQQLQQPGLRIINNRPFGNEPQSQPNPNFHVSKALCIACEKFPWTPVAGGKPDGVSQQQQQQQPSGDQYPAKSANNLQYQPSNTIVISALGEAKDPIPLPPQQANRKPFAIQFDSSQSQNSAPQSGPPSQKQQYKEQTPTDDTKNRDPATRPITFQIYDPPRQQPTVLRPVVGNQQQQPGGYPVEPAPFMQPPPNQGYQIRPIQIPQHMLFQSQTAYRPTVLQPVSQSYGMVPPPPPSSQGGYNNFPPRNAPQQQPPQAQSSSGNNNPQVPPITISTIVAAQHGGGGVRQMQQQYSPIPNFQGIQPAKLVYQEHTEVRPQKTIPIKNQPQIQYGKPFPPPPPQNIQMPIMSRPFGPFPNQNGGYISPPQNRPSPGTYLPPQQSQGGQQKPPGNQYIINLRPPMPMQIPQQQYYAPQQGQRPPSGQIFFPNQNQNHQQQQTPKQYGPPIPIPQGLQAQQPSGVNQQSNQISNDVKYGTPQSRPQQTEQPNQQPPQSHSSNIVPIPVPNQESPSDYYQAGSTIQNERENPSNNFVPPPPKVPFNPPRGVVKNPHIQSIENVQPPQPPKELPANTNPTTAAPLVQESGWEIVPAIQTDITHLFQTPTKPTEQSKQVPSIPLPIPVPIPIPESHASKSPVFVVRNQGNRPLSPNDPKIHGNIVVQGITYHEEQNNKNVQVPQPQSQTQSQPQPQYTGPSPPNTAYSTQQQVNIAPPPPPNTAYSTQQQVNIAPPPPPNTAYNTQQQTNIAPPPQVVSHGPGVQPQIMLRPHPGSQFDPLPASISTALYHAQRTSYLTHQYWQNANNGNVGPGGRTVYVHSIPVVRPQYPQVQVSNNVFPEGGSDSSPVASNSNVDPVPGGETQVEIGAQEIPNQNQDSDQSAVNCQNHQQWATPQNEESLSSAPVQQQPQQPQQRQPYLMYYPPPVQQSSIFWMQSPPRPNGEGRQRPNLSTYTGDASKEGPVFSKPVYEWSRIVGQSQSHTVNENTQSLEESKSEPSNQGVPDGTNSAVEQEKNGEEYAANIPFGEKLPKRPTVTPFDIISVGGNDESQVQSLEEENVGQPNSNADYQPQEPGSLEHNSYDVSEVSQEGQQHRDSNTADGQNGLNEFPQGGNANNNQNQDFEDRPVNPNYILRPVSTTIIHSPESSSYASQSFGTQSFRPQKVIVHDFTKGNDDSSSSPNSPAFEDSQVQEEAYGQPSQNVHSWQSFNEAVRPKSPKLVDEQEYHQKVDDDDDKQSLASVSNAKVVQYHNLATGSVTTAECATAQSDPISLTASTETAEDKIQDSPTKNVEKVEKVRFRQGTRFPAGRPSLASFNAWTPTSTSTNTAIPVDYDQGSLETDSHNPGSASISIPVYRPPNPAVQVASHSWFSNNKWSPPKNVILDDIYTNSDVKQHSYETGGIGPIIATSTEGELTSSHPAVAVTEDASAVLTTMSTEKSSTYSVSMEGGPSIVSEHSEPTGRKVSSGSEIRFSPILDVERPVYIVTSAPVRTTSTSEQTTSSATTPSPGGTSTKIVKTVRVRQRMRPGSFGVKNRFNGTTRVRVVHRPVIPEYVRHFPELVTPESEKLGQHEEEEIKNALIELKRTERAKH